MHLNSAQLDHLPVFTVAGTFLGYVVGFDLNVETHGITTYYVSRSRWLNRSDHVIAAAQVVSVADDKMVVHDAAVSSAAMAPQHS